MNRFTDRRAAGRLLAQELLDYADRSDVLIIALPRGGVPVGYEIATRLGAPLDVLVVRKIGTPWNEELAIGAVASGGTLMLDNTLISELRIGKAELDRIIAAEMRELERRDALYRGHRRFPELAGRVVIVVDDGLATGASMLAALRAIRQHSPANLIVAVPVASRSAVAVVEEVADSCVTLMIPEPLYGVGMYYDDFSQTSDHEVLALLERAARSQADTLTE
jgi:predicted phosphoribosyltransferase